MNNKPKPKQTQVRTRLQDTPLKWFGPSWGAAVCDPHDHIETPAGELCRYCNEPIDEMDSGFVFPEIEAGQLAKRVEHLECFIREVAGSVGHIRQECACYGGNEADPEHCSTKREAAIAAYLELRFPSHRPPS